MKRHYIVPVAGAICIAAISLLVIRLTSDKPAASAATDSGRIQAATERVNAAQVRAKRARAQFTSANLQPTPAVKEGAPTKGTPVIYGTQWGREQEPEMKDFSDWAGRYGKAPAADKAQLTQEGVRLAKERAALLAELIEFDPEAALAMAMPQSVRNELPPEVLAHAERRVTGLGRLEVLASTPEGGRAQKVPAVQRTARIAGRSYQAHVYGGLKRFGTVDNLYMHGIEVNGSLALADAPVRELESGERLVASKSIVANHTVVKPQIYQAAAAPEGHRLAEDGAGYVCLCSAPATRESYDTHHWAALGGEGTIAAAIGRAYRNTGSRSWLIIPVEFPDRTGSPWSSDSVRDSRIAEVKDFFVTSSYGLFNVNNATVAPLVTLPSNRSAYRESDGTSSSAVLTLLRTDAAAAAFAASSVYNVDNYDFVSIVINHDLWTDAAGVGQLGAKYSWINGYNGGSEQDQRTRVYTHELGHNLGLWHAKAWNPDGSTPDDLNGASIEYGHPFDEMGNEAWAYNYSQNHYNASFKNALDWLPDGYVQTINTNNTTLSTNLTLHAMDRTQVSGRTYAIKIPAGLTLGGVANLDYWIEYRSRFDTTSGSPDLRDEVLIYTSNAAHDDGALKLLDMTPNTSTFTDAGLPVGSSFTAAHGPWRITVNSNAGSGDDSSINVTLTDTRPPSITTHPEGSSTVPGTAVTLTVSATGPSLSYQWYKDGAPITGATSSSFTIASCLLTDAGSYHVVVTNAYGSATSNAAVLEVAEGGGGGGGGGGCGYTTPPEQLLLIGWGVLLLCHFLQRLQRAPVRPLQPRPEAA